MHIYSSLIFSLLFSFHLFGQSQSDRPGNAKPNTAASQTKEPQAADEKRFDHQPTMTLNADRDLIVRLLMKQMKDKGFRLTKKEPDVLVFEQRIPGAAAAVRRNSYDRSTMTPIVDDPKMIMAFGLESKEKATLVVARMMITTIFSSQIIRRDITEKKEGRISLNKILEQLKSDLEKEQSANK